MTKVLRIGTRGSPLALAQANQVKALLAAAHPELAGEALSVVPIRTTGDRVRDRPLAEIGGKGLFTKEIEEALLDRRIDIAVHSMKDVPTKLPPGLVIDCILPREDPRDALICPAADSLAALPPGTVVGSSSLRRRAQLLNRRPDLEVVGLRGNVGTRLARVEDGTVGATLLACAGLNRLGQGALITAPVPPEVMLPAIAQGAIGIEQRADDTAVGDLLAAINHRQTALCVALERAFLTVLDGSCQTPIAGLALLTGSGMIHFRGEVLAPDGTEVDRVERRGAAADAVAIGREAGADLIRRAGPAWRADR